MLKSPSKTLYESWRNLHRNFSDFFFKCTLFYFCKEIRIISQWCWGNPACQVTFPVCSVVTVYLNLVSWDLECRVVAEGTTWNAAHKLVTGLYLLIVCQQTLNNVPFLYMKKAARQKGTQISSQLLNCWHFGNFFLPFSTFHWDQFSHWQEVRLFLQPVTGKIKKLMFTGGTDLALLFALFFQLHRFTLYVNINLRVFLCCCHFSFQWKYAARVQGINNKAIYLVIYSIFSRRNLSLIVFLSDNFLSSYFCPCCFY